MNINQRLYYEAQFNLLGHTLCKMFGELDKENPQNNYGLSKNLLKIISEKLCYINNFKCVYF